MHQRPAIGVRIGAHPAVADRRQRGDLRPQAAALVEQFLRAIAPHPIIEKLEMLRLVEGERNLMGAPRPLGLEAVDKFWPGPAFEAAQDYHRPDRPAHRLALARRLLDGPALAEGRVQRCRHLPVSYTHL